MTIWFDALSPWMDVSRPRGTLPTRTTNRLEPTFTGSMASTVRPPTTSLTLVTSLPDTDTVTSSQDPGPLEPPVLGKRPSDPDIGAPVGPPLPPSICLPDSFVRLNPVVAPGDPPDGHSYTARWTWPISRVATVERARMFVDAGIETCDELKPLNLTTREFAGEVLITPP